MFGLHKFQFTPYYSPDDNPGGAPLTADGILDILNEPDDEPADELDLSDKKPVKEEKKKEADSEDNKDESDESDEEDGEKDELEEIEEELDLDDDKDEDEDELELITPVKRREILAKYPQLFKDFPYLEKAYYREQKYSQIFPDLNDARKAQEDAQILKEFESRILTGDISTVISELKKQDENSFLKLVDNYLPTLQKIDEKAFFHVVNSIVKPIIYKMAETGTNDKDEELTTAARVLNQFFYGSTRWEPHKPLAKTTEDTTENKESENLKREREALFTERYNNARSELQTRVDSTFRKAIEKHIDPKQDMTPYVLKQASRDAYEQLSESLSKDSRFRTLMDRAWRKAGEKNFDKDSMENIRRIINARAQTVLPTVIKKARIEALKGMGKRVRDTSDNTDNNTEKGRSTSSNNRGPLRQSSQNRSSNTNKNEIPKGMSNKDFIMSD